MKNSGYLELSEEQNALDYLIKTVSFIKTAERNPLDWKWAILATHAALYGFMVCALKGTDFENVRYDTKRGRKLISFLTAFERCQDEELMAISGFQVSLKPSPEQKEAVKLLNHELRNEFMHYVPKLWAIEKAVMLEVISHVLDVVRMVSLEMGCYCVHYNDGDTEKIAALISEAQQILRGYSQQMSAAHA